MKYAISHAGQFTGTMAAIGIPVRTTTYATIEDAARDVARVMPGDTDAIFDAMEIVPGDAGGAYLYANEEDAERDADGSRAIAIVVLAENPLLARARRVRS